jgi:transcriptional regulator with XRE-family HTH domain
VVTDRRQPDEEIGHLIARLRAQHGKTQEGLAEALRNSTGKADGVPDRFQVHRWEAGRRIPVPYMRRHLSLVLGVALDELDKAAATAKARRTRPQHRQTASLKVDAAWVATRASKSAPGEEWQLELPGGRTLGAGVAAQVQVHELDTAADGTATLSLPDDQEVARFLRAGQRGVLLCTAEQPAPVRVLDPHALRIKMARMPDLMPSVTVPAAYALDDITWAIIWALASLDDGLLADDHELDEASRELAVYEQLAQSAVSQRAAPGLTPAARMWLGSDFCARHILRHLAEPGQMPVFWTCEQYGEEASVWLFFRHKYNYLKSISSRFTGSASSLARGFCVPEAVVTTSPPWERCLLLLAAALMESLGIRVDVCTEPEYGTVEGFVLVPGKQAIIATWVRADGIWHVGSTSSLPVLRDFTDVTRHASTRSLVQAATPALRLQALADYLSLDWHWLQRRCAELATYGCAALISPRSRLLSVSGLDAALRYVGALHDDGRG